MCPKEAIRIWGSHTILIRVRERQWVLRCFRKNK